MSKCLMVAGGGAADETFQPYNYGNEIALTWSEISDQTKKGDFSDLRIGDCKTVTLTTGEVVIMEIAAINPYIGTGDKEAGNHILWVSRDCLATTYRMNATDTNNGASTEPNPYRASALFYTLQNNIYPTIPAEIRAHIIEIRGLLEKRYSASGALNNSNGWAWNSRGKAILLTPIEVFGTVGFGDTAWANGAGVNVHLPLFFGTSKHFIKRKGNGGERVGWWLATASANISTAMSNADDRGMPNGYISTTRMGVPLSFFTG